MAMLDSTWPARLVLTVVVPSRPTSSPKYPGRLRHPHHPGVLHDCVSRVRVAETRDMQLRLAQSEHVVGL